MVTPASKYFFIALPLLLLCLLLSLNIAVSAPSLPPLNKSPSEEQYPGKFIWFELAAVDVQKQKNFYGAVFGWQFQNISQTKEQYTIIKNDDHQIAGLFQIEPRSDARAGALWIGLLSVTDPAKAISIVKNAGGAVHTPATTMAKRGTYALLRDPEGALFGILKSDSGDPPDRETQTGDFLWLDLYARDIRHAAAFYQQLAGYEIVDDEQGKKRKFLRAAGRFRAGIVPLPDEANRSGWLPYVKVDDVAATLKRVEAAGGHIMVAPDKSLLNGNLAVFADPLGGIIGIVKWKEP